MILKGKESAKVAVLFHRMGPYHFARLRAAGKLLNLLLIEIFQNDSVYGWNQVMGAEGFERQTLFENESHSTHEIRTRIQATLDVCQPSAVIIPGWSGVIAFSAIQWCRHHQVPAVVMSESTEWDEPRQWWKEWIKARLINLYAGALVGGSPHKDYLIKLGMPRDRIFLGYDAIDNDYFADKVAPEKNKDNESKVVSRKQYALPEKYFLASARFVEKKNLLKLIEAYARYRELVEKNIETSKANDGKQKLKYEFQTSVLKSSIAEPWHLVLLGDGLLKADLVNLISKLGLQNYVHLPGFKQYDELPEYYGLSRVFIHASTTEQWGLVVNEAMASGLPVLVSNRCGCAQDLVKEGGNGFSFNPRDMEELAGLMFKISAVDFPLSDFGLESQRIISEWGPKRFADGLQQAVKSAVDVPRSQTGMVDGLLLKSLLMK